MVTTGVLGCLLMLVTNGYAVAADEPTRGEWTQQETAQGYVVFSHSTLERLGADYVPSRAAIVNKLSCALAGNEFESLQLGVHAIGSDLKNVAISVETDLQVKVYHGDISLQPTYSLPVGVVKQVASGTSIKFWLTFHASHETPAGLHAGKIRIKPADADAMVLDLEVHVRPFVLHRPRISIGIYYPQGGGDDKKWTANFKDMAEHGQTAIALYDYTPWMKVKEGKDGTLRFLRLAKAAGLAHADIPWVWLFGGGFDYVEDGETTKGNDQSRLDAVNWLLDKSREQGWPELINYGADEPPYPLSWLRPNYAAWRQVPMRLTTAMDAHAAYGHGDFHDVWIEHCPLVTPQMRAEAQRMGAQLWTYSCVIRQWEPLRERYLTGMFTWANKLLGSYLWAGPGYDQHSWSQGGPVPTIGWEMRREGVDDYRYFQMLEDCIAAKPQEMLAVEAAGWLEAVRQRYNMNPHAVVPGTPLPLDEYDAIRATAADYIERLGAVSEDGLKPPPVTFLKDEAKGFRDKTIEQCIGGLSSADVWQRRSAAWALYERGGEAVAATEALAGLLDDDDVRMVALHALEAIGYEAYPAVPKVAALMAHDDAFVRIGAIYVLGAIGAYPMDPPRKNPHEVPPPAPTPAAATVVEPLRAVLNDDEPVVSYIAGRTLSRLGPVARNALPEAIAMLDATDGNRRGAAWTLIASMGPAGAAAVPRLVEMVDAKSGDAGAECTVLAAIGPAAIEAVPVLEKWADANPDYHSRDRIFYALFCISGDRTYLDSMVAIMKDKDLPDWKMRHMAIWLDALGAAAAPVADDVRQIMESKYAKLLEGGLMDPFFEKVKKGEGPRRLMP